MHSAATDLTGGTNPGPGGWGPLFYSNSVSPQCLLGSPWWLGKAILGPCAPCPDTFVVLITSFMVSCVFGVCRIPRPNFRVYLGFCMASEFLLSFCLVLFLHLQPDQFCDFLKNYLIGG